MVIRYYIGGIFSLILVAFSLWRSQALLLKYIKNIIFYYTHSISLSLFFERGCISCVVIHVCFCIHVHVLVCVYYLSIRHWCFLECLLSELLTDLALQSRSSCTERPLSSTHTCCMPNL